MARSTIALALLGLLACAAVAQAENAETQKRHHGGHGDYDNKYHHEEEHWDNKRQITFKVAPNPAFNFEPKPFGALAGTVSLTFGLLDKEGVNTIAQGRLTGVVTEIVGAAPPTAFTINGDLSIVVADGRYKGTILTASGPLTWDLVNKVFIAPLNTMVVTGASGLLEGADGTVVLANAAPSPTVTFNLRLRSEEGKHGKDY